MIKSRVVFLVSFLVLSTALASAAASPAEAYKEAIRPNGQGPVEDNPQADQDPLHRLFYTENRWIALRKEGLPECPGIDGWQGDSLLKLVLRDDQEDPDYEPDYERHPHLHGHHDLVLDRLCVYTHTDSSKKFPEPPPAGLVAAERDRMAITAMAHVPELGAVGDPSWKILADQFLDQTGQVRLDSTDAPRVRLVFIDTHPTEEWPLSRPLPGKSWHGYTMAHLAHEMVCGDGKRCPIEIATRSALCYDHYESGMTLPSPAADCPGGGRLGLVNDLAVAILKEVHHWETTEPDTKLVLNLSVGWDGELEGQEGIADLAAENVSQLSLSARAVYEALRYARHQGVLVIAAAGNQRGGGPDTRWPVLPAAWELQRPAWWPFRLFHRPVYAVGGVDWQGLPLANSRHQGRPRRATYADHAVARTAGSLPDESTMMYTGTSVSAAVASSIAAVLWHLRPELRPTEVMRLMGRSADVLGTRADFYAWRPLSPLIPPPYVRRLSLCESVLRACGPAGSRCDSLGPIDCQFGKHPAADLSFVHLPPATTSFEPASSPPSPCDSRARLFEATTRGLLRRAAGTVTLAADLCPMEALPDMTRPGWTGPQPGDNPCPTCTIVPEPPRSGSLFMAVAEPQGYALLADVDPEWKGGTYGTITGAILAIDCYDGGSPERISFDLDKNLSTFLPPGIPAKINLGPIDGRESLVGCTASIDFSVMLATETVASRSAQSPVYVDP